MTDWRAVPVFGTTPAGVIPRVRPSAYGIVSDGSGHVAVLHSPIGLTLPGGGSDDNEAPELTIVRETREECGLIVRVGSWRRAAIEHRWSHAEHVQFEKWNTFCDAAVVGETGEPGEADHVLEWMSIGDAVKRLAPLSHQWALSEWQAR